MSRILVTSALPYANGPIHLGHLVEYIQTDIWVRFQKLRGQRCVYVCADDTHGTAIMIRARKEGVREEDLIARMQQAHLADFTAFQIEFDNYGSTHSAENRAFCEEIWQALRRDGLVSEKEVEQLYDPVAGTFLADRFVKGTCPKCKTPDQYGDSCVKCDTHYDATDLIDPKSTLSGATPEIRKARHLFVNIERLHGFLDQWAGTSGALQPEIANYLKGHFLHEPLRDWDVSRPAPYFGFEIPDSPGNYWYVWFDAPIGYIASTKQWCDRHGEQFDDWWRSAETEVHHFIGKDITYFHTLFWPAMLKTAGFNLPKKVHIHGFLTVNGKKMSKRDGTFVQAATYLRASRSGLLALLLCREARQQRRGPRPESRRVPQQGQCRHRGQVRQPGQPHGEFREEERAGRGLSRRRRAVRPGGPGRRSDCRGLSRPAISPGRCGSSWPPPIGPTSSSTRTPPGTSAARSRPGGSSTSARSG